MDPFTALCRVIEAYVQLRTVEFNAMPPEEQLKVAKIRADTIEAMYAFAVKVHDDAGGVIGKLKAAIGDHGPVNPPQPTK